MLDSLQTRPSLLVRLRDALDAEAWGQFVELYGPAILRFARKRGLQDADAADLQQNVFATVSQGMKQFEYDPTKGSFRGWMYGVVRHQLAKLLERERRSPRGSGDTAMVDQLGALAQPAEDESALWDQECKLQTFRWAAERVRIHVDKTSWQAFWRTAVEDCPAAEVAAELGMRSGAVYTAKSRVLARIKREILEMIGEP